MGSATAPSSAQGVLCGSQFRSLGPKSRNRGHGPSAHPHGGSYARLASCLSPLGTRAQPAAPQNAELPWLDEQMPLHALPVNLLISKYPQGLHDTCA